MTDKKHPSHVFNLMFILFLTAGMSHITMQAAMAGPAFKTVQYMPRNMNDVPRISPEALNSRLENGESILIVDTRSAREFDGHHIAGAISIPLEQVQSSLDELPKDRDIVFYCT
jgi:3-mercaptopyruvate sulfurtransferase SseA